MFNLTQVQDRAKLIEMFLGGLHEIFEPAVFEFTKESAEETPPEIEIRTRRSHFGFIRITKSKDAPKEHLPMLQNATQMLAVLLERLYFDRQLQKENVSLEQMADERNKELKKKIKELEQARNATLNLVEDLNHEITQRTKYEKELKESEENLRQSEEKFRKIVEKAPDPIFIQTEKKFAFLNPAACKLFGIESPDKLIGSPVMDRFHPDYHKQIKERIKRLNEKREAVTDLFEQKFIRMDDSEVWVESAGVPITYQGKNVALVFVRDITQRKQAEENLRHLKDNLQEEVNKKTKELNERVEILERFQNATVEREFRIKELKEEMQRLKNSQQEE